MMQLKPGDKVFLKKGKIKMASILYHVRTNKESQGYVVLDNGDWVYERDLALSQPDKVNSTTKYNSFKSQLRNEMNKNRVI